MLTDAVAIPLHFWTTLIALLSILEADDNVATFLPVVKRSDLVPKCPVINKHLTVVSATQIVRSHPECSARDAGVCPVIPNPSPEIVMLDEPVAPTFFLVETLTAATSTLKAFEILPDARPTVTLNFLLCIRLCPLWHLAAVSDCQDVRSQADCPKRNIEVYITVAIPLP